MAVPMLLIRSPMLSQVERVVAHAAISCNSEVRVLEALAATAAHQGVRHGVLLMGIGTNLGCQHGIAPDAINMAELSSLATTLQRRFALRLPWCSGGNSATLPWLAAGGDPGRINHLRLGEALLLGREPLGRTAIPGLYTDAITLVAEVIEAKLKPSQAWGDRGHTSFSSVAHAGLPGPQRCADPPSVQRALLALGE
ncbi:MAG: hypothetical protein AB1Z21_04225 [Synechococcaceae cyanobacterium]